MIELGGDDLAEKLDSLHGGEVTDHSVFHVRPFYGLETSTPSHCVCYCLPSDAILSQDWPEGAHACAWRPCVILLHASLFCLQTCQYPDLSLCVYREHAARYEQDFINDMQKLGCKMPSLLTRVSDFHTGDHSLH